MTIRRVLPDFLSVLQTQAGTCETYGSKHCEALSDTHFTNLIQKPLEPKGCLLKTKEMA